MIIPGSRINARNRAVVLVIVLALIVLLTGVIVAFFSQATSSLQVEVSHGNRSQADLLARSATDYVVGQFEQEIADTTRSTAYPINGESVYVPLQNTYIVPKRAIGSNVPATSVFANLIRQSAPIGDPYDPDASADSTATPAVNGRLLTLARWNLPALLTGNGFDNTNELPNWVYFTQTNGPANSATTAAIGRFAYNVYDESGLLDANVAGYPASVASQSYQLKGTQAGADLTQISGVAQTDVNNLIAFRNPNVSTAADYLDYVSAAWSKGFLASVVTSPTTQKTYQNNYFANRQDLLHYVATQNTGLTNALPYLTTSSRAAIAPSTQPAVDAANSYTYLTSAESTTLAGASNPNRDLANVRFPTAGTITHYADDGTTTTYAVAAGDPAIQQRFSLAKLAWVTYSGPKSGISAAAIQACFGLTWDGTRWTYVGASGSTALSAIETVDVVASEQREPNFFETLQAAILKGSLGRDAGPAGALTNGTVEYTCAIKSYEGTISDVQSQDKDVVRHVLQIGANIIDQADTDSYPTAIRYLDSTSGTGATAEVYGIENLPYPARTIPTGVQSFGASQNTMNFYLQVEMWNPHQQVPAPSAGTYPTSFRVRDDPSAPSTIEIMNLGTSPTTYSPAYALAESGEIDFSNAAGAAGFSDPALLTSLNSTTTNAQNNGGTGYAMALTGTSPVPIYGLLCGAINASSTGYVTNATLYPVPTTLSLVYEYQSNGTWYPYTRTRRMKYHGQMLDMFSGSAHPPYGSNSYAGDNTTDVHLDPRTDRFGCFGRWCDPAGFTDPGQQLAFFPPGYKFSDWPSYAQNIGGNVYCPRPNSADSTSAFTMTPLTSVGSYAGKGYQMGRLADNVTLPTGGNLTYYSDIDGTVRGAAGYWAAAANPATGSDGRPLFTGNTASRPVVLNRPFQSVGELGYVFRDVPWKELDLFTPDSGDAALLDAFCVADAGRVSAGKLSLNTSNKPVLQALLAGATKDPAAATTLTPTEAANLTTLLVTRTTGTGAGQGPLLSTADLVRKFSADLTSAYSTASDPLIKLRREAAARALAEVGNTRTWNLMIDVVAQTGTCRQVGQFIVQGEKRYWVHVAIDRYTGKLVDESLENVNE